MTLLSSLLADYFSKSTRQRGSDYADDGLVDIVEASATHVQAVVDGTRPYDVELTLTMDGSHAGVAASCTCPYAEDEQTPCKHIWATLLTAELPGHFEAFGNKAATGARLLLTSDLDAFDDLGEPDGGKPSASDDLRPSVRTHAARQLSQSLLAHLSQEVQRRSAPDASRYRYADGELLYVFDVPATLAGQGLTVRLVLRKRKKNGEWGKPKPVGVTEADLALAAPVDRRILASLMGGSTVQPMYAYGWQGGSAGIGTFRMGPALAADLVPLMTRAGRAMITTGPDARADLLPIGWDEGPPWTFRPRVEGIVGGAGYRLAGDLIRPDESPRDIREPALVTSNLLFGRTGAALFDPGPAFSLVAALRQTGTVELPPEHAITLAQLLTQLGTAADALPDDLRFDRLDVTPTPILRLATPQRGGPQHTFEATLAFDYDGTVVPIDAPPPSFDTERRRVVIRHAAGEADARAAALAAGVQALHDWRTNGRRLMLSAYQLPATARTLTANGWRVEADGRAYRAAGRVHLNVSSGVDWFDLHGTVEFGPDTAPLTEVLAALRRGERTVRLDDGSVGMLPEEWLRRYAPLAAAGADAGEGRLRFTRPQTLLLDALLADRAEHAAVSVDETFARARQELARFDRIEPVDAPPTFIGALRDYQREGLGWFAFLRRFGFGGCLADDMGLGKTVMVLALLDARRIEHARSGEGRRTSAIVVPRSLVHNWMAEAARFTPSLRMLDYSSTDRRTRDAEIPEHDVVLLTYGTLRQDVTHLKDVPFEYVVLDEAQAVKNAATASAKAVRLLEGRYRLALSGTPIENHLGELWSLFEFLNPGLLGASTTFRRAASRHKPDLETTGLLARGLRPFILRRTKAQVARELPARTEQTLTCELSKPERAFYDGLRRHFREFLLRRVDAVGLAKSKIQILEALLRLRQAACHSGLVDRTRAGGSSAKIDLLLPKLAEVADEGHKALVFSQFTTLLGFVKPALDAARLTYEYLDGRTRDRAARVERFQQDPDCPIFLVSLKAGGLGLNLTAAEYVFLLDPWWNPAVEAQAIDRAHRIGQTREVFAYRLIAEDTVEEKVLALQQSKRSLAEAVLSADAGGLKYLEREDLELLLS